MKIKKRNIKIFLITITVIILLSYIVTTLQTTGFLQESKLDDRDLATWEYENGKIKHTDEFTHVGRTDTCWILIHSYTATPAEMRELANTINVVIEDFVFVPKLSGHGEVPSNLKDKSLETWYDEVEGKYNTFYGSLCDKINLVGSSFGANIALRLAQEKDSVKNLYIINPFITKPYEFHKILPFETRTKLLANILNYKKNKGNAKINSPEGLASHVSYWNMPYDPVKDSLSFIEETTQNLNKINVPTFIAYSENDEVSGSHSATLISDNIGSSNKLVLNYKDSNHVLLMDFDKDNLIRDIIKFEQVNR